MDKLFENPKKIEILGKAVLAIMKALIPVDFEAEFGVDTEKIGGNFKRKNIKEVLDIRSAGAKYIRKVREFDSTIHFSVWHTITNEKIYEEPTETIILKKQIVLDVEKSEEISKEEMEEEPEIKTTLPKEKNPIRDAIETEFTR